tara:strand:- start:1150 stop:1830 length:681 start_codon:yes stop_codon:yes gene_type:complete
MTSPTPVNVARLAELGLAQAQPAAAASKELGQAEFFDLMVAQLKFQDPLEPQGNTEFVSQMAQFSSVESLSAIEGSLGNLAGSLQSNQALQASTLVGRDVLVPSRVGFLPESGEMIGAVELPESMRDVRLRILDANGESVRTIDLGTQPQGRIQIGWDGTTDGGARAAPGTYSFAAEGRSGESPIAVDTLVRTRVDSVSLTRNPPGATLNLSGIGPVSLDAVRELH